MPIVWDDEKTPAARTPHPTPPPQTGEGGATVVPGPAAGGSIQWDAGGPDLGEALVAAENGVDERETLGPEERERDAPTGVPTGDTGAAAMRPTGRLREALRWAEGGEFPHESPSWEEIADRWAGLGNAASRNLEKIAIGAGEILLQIPPAVARGAGLGLRNTAALTGRAGDWIYETMPEALKGGPLDGIAALRAATGRPDLKPSDLALGVPLGEAVAGSIPDPKTVTSEIAKTLGELLVGIPVARGVTAAFNLPAGWWRNVIEAGIAGGAALDPDAPRLATLVQQVLPNPITDYLEADPDDTDAEKRLKNALEFAGLAGIAELVIRGLAVVRARSREAADPHPAPPPQAGEGGARSAREGEPPAPPPQAGEGGARSAREGGPPPAQSAEPAAVGDEVSQRIAADAARYGSQGDFVRDFTPGPIGGRPFELVLNEGETASATAFYHGTMSARSILDGGVIRAQTSAGDDLAERAVSGSGFLNGASNFGTVLEIDRAKLAAVRDVTERTMPGAPAGAELRVTNDVPLDAVSRLWIDLGIKEGMDTVIGTGAEAMTVRNLVALAESKGIPVSIRRVGEDLERMFAPPKIGGGIAGGLPPEMRTARVSEPIQANVVDAATELLTAGGVRRNPSVRISDQIADLLTTARLKPGEVVAILDRHGVTYEEFAAVWRADVAQTARDLGRLGIAQRRLQAAYRSLSPEERAALDGALEGEGLDMASASLSTWRRLDNARRAALVVQPATAMRNLETQLGRVGLDAFVRLIDESLQIAAGRKAIADFHPAQVFAVQLRLFRKNKALAEDILSYFPADSDRLFFRYASDIVNAPGGSKVVGGALKGAEDAVHFLNGMNRFQEFIIRRAVFLGELEGGAARRGLGTLSDLEAAGRLHTLPKEAIVEAVDAALETTFAKNFAPTSLAGHFIGFINKMPGATLPFPFPRFMMNAVEYVFDYNPTGFLKLLGPAERARVAAGDFGTIAKATVGTAALLGAYQVRNDPELAGERWYEIRGPDGRMIDIRPFNPFASWFFLADIAKRSKDGTLQSMSAKDIAFGVLSVNVRAGTGLAMLDQLVDGLAGMNDGEKIERFLKEVAGETLAGPLVFIQPLRDLVAQFDEKERVIRDTSNAPFLGPFLRKLPYGTRGFPEAESPTRAGPRETQAPLLRQATGIGLRQPKNPLEAELDRLGFRWSDYAPRTGDVEADRQINAALGPMAEAVLVPLVTGPAWRALGDRTKAFILARQYQKLRAAARRVAAAGDPVRFERLRLKRLPKRERRMLRELGADPVETLDRMMESSP